jgi:hypothetical protein
VFQGLMQRAAGMAQSRGALGGPALQAMLAALEADA